VEISGKEETMLEITILTWAPDKREEVIKRVQKLGMKHEGIKVIGTWVDLQGGRAFQLNEVPADPMLGVKANHAWSDLMDIETVHVMEGEEFMKLLSTMK
jgi:hypothetical protein